MVAAGCGDDDDEDAAGTTEETTEETTEDPAETGEGDLAAYCEGELELELAPPPDVDFATASPDEISEALKTYATDVIQPAAEGIAAAAPEEIATDLDVLVGAADEMASTGDPAIWEDPEVAAANEVVHQFDLDNCGWSSQEVTATEYGFDGLPGELPAGVTSFELANDGNEVHELLVMRRNDGVTESVDELLALPEEEAMAKVTMLGEPAFAPPGESAYAVFDLEPGDYIVACFIPVGMTSDDGPPPDGPPHAMQGMVSEFTVS